MDLTIPHGDAIVNIRVAGLLKTPRGYLFQQTPRGWVFPVGGRVKLGETTHDAAVREIEEEVGVRVERLALCSVIENFYTDESENKDVHEMCYVYAVEDEYTGDIPEGFVEIPVDAVAEYDIRPKMFAQLIHEGVCDFRHLVNDEIRTGSSFL